MKIHATACQSRMSHVEAVALAGPCCWPHSWMLVAQPELRLVAYIECSPAWLAGENLVDHISGHDNSFGSRDCTYLEHGTEDESGDL